MLSLDGKLEFMSAGGQGVMEVDDTSKIYGCLWPEFWPGPGGDKASKAVEEAKAGRTAYFEGHAPTAKGSPRCWEVTVTPTFDDEGRTSKLLSISRDISGARSSSWSARRWRTSCIIA